MMKDKSRLFKQRTNVFVLAVLLIFLLMLARLFYLQIIQGNQWRTEGENQYFSDLNSNFDRGSIYFSSKNGKVAAVSMINKYDLAIDPKTTKNFFEDEISGNATLTLASLENNYYTAINQIFVNYRQNNPDTILEASSTASSTDDTELTYETNFLSQADFLAKLNTENSGFEYLVKNIPEDVALAIEKLNLRGVIVNKEKTREYFYNDLASQILGFVGFKGTERTGLYGLEKYYNNVLEKNSDTDANFFAEVFSDFNKKEDSATVDDKNLKGDLNLTIDVNVEKELHQVLEETAKEWDPQSIGGVIMNINDGSILAMDGLPSFNPNDYQNVSDISQYQNNLVSGVYEMGSIIKALTMAAALDSGKVTEDTTYDDTGTVHIDGFPISNWDFVARGPGTTMQTILSQSLNVGIAWIIQNRLGEDLLSKYFHNFGLGQYTGIDLPGEAEGLVNNLDTHIMVDSVTAGFGQGIALTPIQTVRALASLGNGGKLVTPHVVKSITYDNGETRVIVPDEPKEIFEQASTSKDITDMLIKFVDEELGKGNPLYSVASKSGTAQIPDPSTGKYYANRYLNSWMGYFPATKPEYIILLYQKYPKNVIYASKTLQNPFFELVDYLIKYYEVRPDRDLSNK